MFELWSIDGFNIAIASFDPEPIVPSNSRCDRMEWKAAQREIEMSDTEANFSIAMKERTVLLMVISATKYVAIDIASVFECCLCFKTSVIKIPFSHKFVSFFVAAYKQWCK